MSELKLIDEAQIAKSDLRRPCRPRAEIRIRLVGSNKQTVGQLVAASKMRRAQEV